MENKLVNKIVLVTGGAGAIGSQLVNFLLEFNNMVIVVDDLSSGNKLNLPKSSNIVFIQGDIADDNVLYRAFQYNPSIVFHLAAFFANQNSVDYPQLDLLTNGKGTLKLFQYCSLLNDKIERVIYASSGCSIYPSDGKQPYTEDMMTMNLSTPYQITKMLGELYGNYFYKIHGLKVSHARFFNSFGAGEIPGKYRNVIPNFIFWAISGRPLPITGTGDETRDFTSVNDIIKGLVAIYNYDHAVGEAYNLAAGREVKIIDLALMINKLTGNQAGIEFKDRRIWDTKLRILASNDKAKKELGFKPNEDFQLELLHTINWFKDNWELIISQLDDPNF